MHTYTYIMNVYVLHMYTLRILNDIYVYSMLSEGRFAEVLCVVLRLYPSRLLTHSKLPAIFKPVLFDQAFSFLQSGVFVGSFFGALYLGFPVTLSVWVWLCVCVWTCVVVTVCGCVGVCVCVWVWYVCGCGMYV